MKYDIIYDIIYYAVQKYIFLKRICNEERHSTIVSCKIELYRKLK